jgi:DNA-binding LacI/PurR family transcriptional regulator
MSSQRRVTLQDIAEAASLSLGSVSLALSGKNGVSPDTRQRVLDVAKELGYVRSTPRPAVSPPTVSLVVERLPVTPASDPFNRPILQGLESAAREHGYQIAMEFVSPEDHPETGHWTKGATAGVIVLGGGDLNAEWVEAAVDTYLPVVMVDHFIPGLKLPAVVPDNLGGAHSATRHLLEMGHARIGFIRGPSKYWTLSERLAGFLLAMQQAGIWPEEALVPPRESHAEEKGYHEMLRLLDLPNPPTAVFAVSDKTAVGAYRAAIERGCSIPNDVSIIGFDDIEVSRALNPPLTTVHVSGETMGRVAFERLRDLITGRERRLSRDIKWTIPTSLVVRGSVARRDGGS